MKKSADRKPVLKRFWPRYQVDTYVYSLPLVRTWEKKGFAAEESSFGRHVVVYLGNIFIALSLVFVPSEIIVWTPPPLRGGSLRLYLRAVPLCLE